MKKICALAAVLALLLLPGCGGDKDKKDKEKEKMPENIISYEGRDGSEFIPVTETEEHGEVVETEPAEADVPEDLGEYQEVFLEGDIIDETSCGGWVMSVSVKDITVNTYNTLTKYILSDKAADTAAHLKPGDAVLVVHHEDENGNQVADELGRVRTEDEPLTEEEIQEIYKKAQAADEAAGLTESGDE